LAAKLTLGTQGEAFVEGLDAAGQAAVQGQATEKEPAHAFVPERAGEISALKSVVANLVTENKHLRQRMQQLEDKLQDRAGVKQSDRLDRLELVVAAQTEMDVHTVAEQVADKQKWMLAQETRTAMSALEIADVRQHSQQVLGRVEEAKCELEEKIHWVVVELDKRREEMEQEVEDLLDKIGGIEKTANRLDMESGRYSGRRVLDRLDNLEFGLENSVVHG
jgi:hypothetical protein